MKYLWILLIPMIGSCDVEYHPVLPTNVVFNLTQRDGVSWDDVNDVLGFCVYVEFDGNFDYHLEVTNDGIPLLMPEDCMQSPDFREGDMIEANIQIGSIYRDTKCITLQ